MTITRLNLMSSDELWMVYEEVTALLAAKITAEKLILEQRLRQLNQTGVDLKTESQKRRKPYPPVVPKFSNPDDLLVTWAGRWKQPRWLKQQLGSGKSIDDFRVRTVAA